MAPVAPMASMVPMVSLTSMTSMEVQEGTDVKAPLMLRSWDAAIMRVVIRVGVHELTTPRETARSRILRWVDKRRLMENELTDYYIADWDSWFSEDD